MPFVGAGESRYVGELERRAILVIAALLGFEVWKEWLIQFFAASALAAPWVLGFEGASVTFHLVAGAASLVLATTRIMLMRRSG